MSLAYVIGDSVKLHVLGVISEYRHLKFQGDAASQKTFDLSEGETSATNIQVKDGDINENNVELDFTPLTAQVELLRQPEISIDVTAQNEACQNAAACIKQLATATTFSIHIEAVGRGQMGMTCTGGDADEFLVLVHAPAVATGAQLQVSPNGVIEKNPITLKDGTNNCVIQSVVDRPAIDITKEADCTPANEPCFQINVSPTTSAPLTTSAGTSLAFGMGVAALSTMAQCFF